MVLRDILVDPLRACQSNELWQESTHPPVNCKIGWWTHGQIISMQVAQHQYGTFPSIDWTQKILYVTASILRIIWDIVPRSSACVSLRWCKYSGKNSTSSGWVWFHFIHEVSSSILGPMSCFLFSLGHTFNIRWVAVSNQPQFSDKWPS